VELESAETAGTEFKRDRSNRPICGQMTPLVTPNRLGIVAFSP
jgi:hypothetical protein